MPSSKNSGPSNSPESRLAPEPEGPEEVYRRFEHLNRRGGGGSLRDLVLGSGKKAVYGAFVAVELAAIVLGFLLEVPYLDTLAIVLPGLLVMFHNGSKNDEDKEQNGPEESAGRTGETPSDESRYGSGEAPVAGSEGGREEETFLDTILRRFGVETPGDETRSGGR